MIRVLRLVGIINAALWFGAAVFFTFVVGPAFFSKDMRALLGDAHAGAAVQVVLARYFALHQVCAGVALVHLLTEGFYLGRPIWRWPLALLVGILLLSGVGAYGLQPRLRALHRTWRGPGTPPELRLVAERSFHLWHGVSQVFNLVVVAGVLVHLVRVTRPPEEPGRWR
jgi:hypothetical protein